MNLTPKHGVWNELLERLSRVTSERRTYIPEIDGLRFFAIAAVVLLHTSTHMIRTLHVEQFAVPPEETLVGWIAARGNLGVDVFFGISGCILALPFAMHYLRSAQPVNLRRYYIRRLTRLEPPYVVSLTILFAAQVLLLGVAFSALWPNFLASLFYVHNIVYDRWSDVNPVAWSLEIEVQFYVLAPLLFLVFRIPGTWTRRLFLIGTALAFILLNHYFRETIEDWRLRKSLITELQLFLMGILLADVLVVDFDDWSAIPRSLLFDLLCIVAVVSLYVCKDTFTLAGEVVFTGAVFMLLLCAFRGRLANSFFKLRTIAVIGGMCYSIYLLHYALIALLFTFTDELVVSSSFTANYLVQLALVVPVVLVVSSVFFVLIERPCMRRDWHVRAWNGIRSKLRASGAEA